MSVSTAKKLLGDDIFQLRQELERLNSLGTSGIIDSGIGLTALEHDRQRVERLLADLEQIQQELA